VTGRPGLAVPNRPPAESIARMPIPLPDYARELLDAPEFATKGGRELIDRYAQEYRGLDRYPFDDGTDHVRVVVRIGADHVVVR
jgi:hypothetical protein